MKGLSKLIMFSVFACLMLFVSVAYAQDVIVAPTGEELKALLTAIGGLKGASTLAIVVVVVQALLLFFRSSFAAFSGKAQITIVYGLTLVGSIVALKVQGMDILATVIGGGIGLVINFLQVTFPYQIG